MKTKPNLLTSAIFLAAVSTCFGQPIITNQPQTQTVPVGSNVTFAVGATGTGSLLYQWQKYVATFTDLPNRTNATLLLTNVQTSDTDDYRVVVTDATGTTNSDVASLTVMVPPGITRITNNNPFVGVGATVKMQVWFTGTTPSIQWYCNELPLFGKTNYYLTLSNVQTNDSGLYTAVITNFVGSVTSSPVSLEVSQSPVIAYTDSLQHKAVSVGTATSFAVTSFGDQPQSVQWRLDGSELPDKTNRTLSFSAVQPSDEGDYTVVVTNFSGAVTSPPARLWVVPPATEFSYGRFTNQAGLRLPYFYWIPTNYVPTRSYPLVCACHGSGTTEDNFLAFAALYPATLVWASYKQQEKDPAIEIWPMNGGEWTDRYRDQVGELLDWFIARFNVDTNRIYVAGLSSGVATAAGALGSWPDFFAAALFFSGVAGLPTNHVPLWVTCGREDMPVIQEKNICSLRVAGGSPIFTEYTIGGHLEAIFTAMSTPAIVDWSLAKRRGVSSTNQPLVSITSPTQAPIYATGTTNLNLAGSAAALDGVVTRVVWTNTANQATGDASGFNTWSVTGIPLAANKTNVVVVVGTTTSWAPAFGGKTTFNDTLTVIQSPIRVTLGWQGTNALLNWTGGGPPYRVQRATDLTTGDWTDFLSNATPPVSLPLDGAAGFYRILGQ